MVSLLYSANGYSFVNAFCGLLRWTRRAKLVIGWLKWLAIPAVIMVLLIMTNELHEWAFDFNSDFVNWSTDYKHGFNII